MSVREFEIAEKNEVIQTIQEVFNNNPETSTLNIKMFGGCYAYNVTRHRNFKAILQLVAVKHVHKPVKMYRKIPKISPSMYKPLQI